MVVVDARTAVGFSIAARQLADEARRRGLEAPGFRSPPRLAGVARSLRRVPGGSAVIAVERRDRDGEEILSDMIDGVLIANHLGGAAAARLRDELTEALHPGDVPPVGLEPTLKTF
jgi:hypothetical protein